MDSTRSPRRTILWLWWATALAAYLLVAAWQLGLPGLHYDEAREAGQNAMELLTGAPVAAFRGAALHFAGSTLPLMVQDYIGALNVYLSLPFLAVSGIGVPNLRALSLLTGLLTLILLERAVSEWLWLTRLGTSRDARRASLSVGGLVALSLAALAPSFVFWSRQGIFVTNLTQPFVLLCIAQVLRWWRTGSRGALLLGALAAGLALYAKLLALWVILPFALIVVTCWLASPRSRPPLSWGRVILAAICFLAPLVPLLLFNVQTGGTLGVFTGNLTRSYYGVDNFDIAGNLAVRLPQLWQTLEGSQFWYLGGPYANPLAPWLALLFVGLGFVLAWRRVLPPVLLVAAAVLLSLFTVSDLFITHYALLLPLLLGCVGVAVGVLVERISAPLRRTLFVVLASVLILWVALDVVADSGYHRALAHSGGLGDHSDASYDLAYALRMGGMGAPIALDWGMDANVRFLSQGTVTPIEVFGYASPAAPDDGFEARLAPFLDSPDNVYLLRTPGTEVFAGRRAVLEMMAAARGLRLVREQVFAQRDGTPLYEIWKAVPQ